MNICFFFVFSLTNLVLAIHPHGEDHVGVCEEELHLVQRLLGLAVRPSSKFIASNAGTLLIYQSYCKVPHGLRLGIFVSMQVCLFLFVLLGLFPVFWESWTHLIAAICILTLLVARVHVPFFALVPI